MSNVVPDLEAESEGKFKLKFFCNFIDYRKIFLKSTFLLDEKMDEMNFESKSGCEKDATASLKEICKKIAARINPGTSKGINKVFKLNLFYA